jgi:hypothetical protein
MRRDYFTLDVTTGTGADEKPVVTIRYDGPAGALEDRLTDDAGAPLGARQVDVSFRLLGGEMDDDASGVFALSNRITGEFLLECNAEAESVRRLIEAAREYGRAAGADDGRFSVRVFANDREALGHEKSTFLVYDTDGDLLRGHSLIPGNVEL